MQWSFGCFTGKKLAAWKWFSLGLVDTTLFVCNCSFQSWDKSMQHVFSKGLQKFIHTGKSFSEALILASVNPQMVFVSVLTFKQYLYTTCSELVFFGELNEQSLITLWVNWFKNESFWHRFTCTYKSAFISKTVFCTIFRNNLGILSNDARGGWLENMLKAKLCHVTIV